MFRRLAGHLAAISGGFAAVADTLQFTCIASSTDFLAPTPY